jgi:hypothetical protein
MKKSEAIENVGFQIKAIEILEFSMKSYAKPVPDIFTYSTNISLEHRVNMQNRILMVLPTAEILDQDKLTILATIKVSFMFEFNSFEGFSNGKTSEIELPEAIIVALNSISISTLRGIMFSLFRGTFLHKVILPVIDPKTFIHEEARK